MNDISIKLFKKQKYGNLMGISAISTTTRDLKDTRVAPIICSFNSPVWSLQKADRPWKMTIHASSTKERPQSPAGFWTEGVQSTLVAAVHWFDGTRAICPGRSVLPLRTRTSNSAEPRVLGMASTQPSTGSLAMMGSRATPLFLDPCPFCCEHSLKLRSLV